MNISGSDILESASVLLDAVHVILLTQPESTGVYRNIIVIVLR